MFDIGTTIKIGRQQASKNSPMDFRYAVRIRNS